VLYIEPSEIKKDDAELETLAIVTRSSRSAFYLNRVLEGLICQSGAKLIWSIVTQAQMSPEHEICVERARAQGIDVVITHVSDGLSLGQLANIGVKATSAHFVLLHDDDDVLSTDFVSLALDKFRKKSDYVAVTCHAAIIHEKKSEKRLDYVLSPGRKNVKHAQLSWNNLIATNTLIYLREMFDQIGGYPEDVKVAEDWLFNLKLAEMGKIAILPKVCAHVFIRKEGSSVNNEKNTSNDDHVSMRSHIRQMAGVGPQDPLSRLDIVRYLIRRFLDRISYKVTGQFLPR